MTGGEPLVSVLMPTYNEVDNIEEGVESVITQTHGNLELIVIDGGSTDGTREKIREFGDERVRIIKDEQSEGISQALNRGIEEASGDFLARMDGDDRSLPQRFEKQLEVFKDNPRTEVVACWYHIIGRGGERITTRKISNSRTFSVDDIIAEGPGFAHGSVMMRSRLFESVNGYRSEFDTAEDLDLWLRISDRYGGDVFQIIPEALYEHRLGAGKMAYRPLQREIASIAKLAIERRQAGLEEPIRDAIEAVDSYQKESFSDSEREAMYQYLVGVAHMQSGELPQARREFLNSLRASINIYALYKLALTAFPESYHSGVQRLVRGKL